MNQLSKAGRILKEMVTKIKLNARLSNVKWKEILDDLQFKEWNTLIETLRSEWNNIRRLKPDWIQDIIVYCSDANPLDANVNPADLANHIQHLYFLHTCEWAQWFASLSEPKFETKRRCFVQL